MSRQYWAGVYNIAVILSPARQLLLVMTVIQLFRLACEAPFEIFGQGVLQVTPRRIDPDPGSPGKMDELKVHFFFRRMYILCRPFAP